MGGINGMALDIGAPRIGGQLTTYAIFAQIKILEARQELIAIS